ncbi:hypothetical protein BpHYR1_013852 [Brachionus plicatilis]|uniref:Uncharacterized protein n=1 Tax=Brachionus plicatilis TaxID=10195 RepID=A0A3M7RSI3_BRAPC|nr:hypothetical protein BpHYR1_013852 [Brachionus plicatilis]
MNLQSDLESLAESCWTWMMEANGSKIKIMNIGSNESTALILSSKTPPKNAIWASLSGHSALKANKVQGILKHTYLLADTNFIYDLDFRNE